MFNHWGLVLRASFVIGGSLVGHSSFPQRWLYRLTLLLAGALAALVAVGPWLDPGPESATASGRLLHLFAADGLVRRTALLVACGLAATALIFFRPGPPAGPHEREPLCPGA